VKGISEYASNLLTVFPDFEPGSEDAGFIEKNGKAQWITKMLLRKRFRKTRVFEENKADVLKKVELSIKENKALHFMAELFAPVLKVHEPGAVLDYGSEDVIMTLMDNYPKADLDRYAKSFERLIKVYSDCIPSNFTIDYVRTGEKYDSGKLKQMVVSRIPEKKKEWEGLSEDERNIHLHRSRRSILWAGQEDWTHLSNGEREEKIEESKIIEDTFYEVEADFLGDYFTGGNRIPLVFSWGLCDENFEHWLTLGSVSSSSVDFWIGKGVIEFRADGKMVLRVVSKEQYESIKEKLEEVKIELDALEQLKNFKSVEVYEGVLEFKK